MFGINRKGVLTKKPPCSEFCKEVSLVNRNQINANLDILILSNKYLNSIITCKFNECCNGNR